jgi:hypothetical protein
VRLASGSGSRAVKYRQLFDEALRLSDAELSLLAVLMLRGPQTPGELKQRTERLYLFESPAETEGVLDGLIERELVARLPRRPGQKEQRYAQRLGEVDDTAEPARPGDDSLEARVERLEAEVRRLREILGALGS